MKPSTELRADCERCFGLCCVAHAFAVSADFAIDKAAGQPCPNLQADFRCGIHAALRERGFPGCAAYGCFGAGQKVAQGTFHGRHWREAPVSAPQMFAVFTVMRQLHELLWYLSEALKLPTPGSLRDELNRALAETEYLTLGTPDELLALDAAAFRDEVNVVLVRASELARGGVGPSTVNYRGADLIGAVLSGADLRGANLRGARLIGADLAHADLTLADLTGADVRGADLRGAELTESLFLTQCQVDSARGDAETRLPPSVRRPAHW